MQGRITQLHQHPQPARSLRRDLGRARSARSRTGDARRGRHRGGRPPGGGCLRRPAERFTAGPLAQQSRILAADGSLIATPYDENRIVVPLAQVAPVMRQAQVAIEDSRFYEHGGVDPQGVARAAVVQPARRRHPGRLDADPAVRQDHPAGEGPAQQRQGRRGGGRRAPGAGGLQPQAAGAQVRRHGREAADQGPDPRRATSTSSTTATRPTASRPPRGTTSGSAPPRSPCPRPPCSRA